ncbi:MAG: LamG-like jellyroll fold domain-containing protein [Sandaracinaceae bacterium]
MLRTRDALRRIAPLVALALVGCASRYPVTIDLRTDLLPGIEFSSVRVRADVLVPPPVHDVDETLSYSRGARVADLVFDVSDAELTVELLDETGALVASRPVEVALSRPTSIVVLITRDCADVRCPGEGEPSTATACYGGTCQSASCTSEHTDACEAPECMRDADCNRPTGSGCAGSICVSGACFYPPTEGRCAAGEVCHPDLGCRPQENVLRCSPPDEDTVLQLAFDDDVADATGVSTPVLTGGATYIDGPHGCRHALSFDPAGPTRVEIADTMEHYVAEGSLELWVRRDNAATLLQGVLAREQRTAGNGEISVWLTPMDEVVVRITDASETEVAGCSAPIAEGEWHHVGINFGPPGFELWVDGTLATSTTPIEVEDAEGTFMIPCGATGTIGLRPADVLPIILGASGARADDATDWSDPLDGALDHLRLSTVRRDFTVP